MKRLSLEETWAALESAGFEVPRTNTGEPFVPDTMPNYDDEEPLGLSFFRTALEETKLENFELPRTFFGRSGFVAVSFRNTSLAGSRMCWNDFEECDFTGADLSACDMRASSFEACIFDRAVLENADLRGSVFFGCTFTDANLAGATYDVPSGEECAFDLNTTEAQAETLAWVDNRGEEPPGG